jgi:hypothetical protein
MDFEHKLLAAFELLESRGVWRRNFAPPMFRLLWRFRVEAPPPHFCGFVQNVALVGGAFSIIWGLAMVALPVGLGGPRVVNAIVLALILGLLFGAVMAGYYRWSARRHGIPLWHEFHPEADPDEPQ